METERNTGTEDMMMNTLCPFYATNKVLNTSLCLLNHNICPIKGGSDYEYVGCPLYHSKTHNLEKGVGIVSNGIVIVS